MRRMCRESANVRQCNRVWQSASVDSFAGVNRAFTGVLLVAPVRVNFANHRDDWREGSETNRLLIPAFSELT